MNIIYKSKGKAAFRPVRALNAAVFEAIVVGVATRLASKQTPPDSGKIGASYDKLLKNDVFMKACISTTATEESVKRDRD